MKKIAFIPFRMRVLTRQLGIKSHLHYFKNLMALKALEVHEERIKKLKQVEKR